MRTILYPEGSWRNTQMSVARFYGGITINGTRYVIVNKEGKDLVECSKEAEKAGRHFAIEPGEPADLIIRSYQPIYKALGRDGFIKWLKDDTLPHDIEAAKEYIKTHKKKSKCHSTTTGTV